MRESAAKYQESANQSQDRLSIFEEKIHVDYPESKNYRDVWSFILSQLSVSPQDSQEYQKWDSLNTEYCMLANAKSHANTALANFHHRARDITY